MKKKIFLLSRIPVEFLPSKGYEIIYWARLFNGHYPLKKYLEKADSEPFPRNSSFVVRIILGFLSDFKGIVIFTTPGTHSEHRTILSILREKNIKILELHTGDNKITKIDEIFHKLKSFFNIENSIILENFKKNLVIRKKMAMEIEKGNIHGTSLHLDALNMASGKTVRFISNKFNGKIRGKILLMGSPSTISIINHIENRGFSVTYTLESLLEIFLIKEEMRKSYEEFPFPSRTVGYLAEKIVKILKNVNIDGIIYLMVPLSHEFLEYELFKEKINKPIIPIEISNPWKLDKRTILRIDSFLEVLEKKL